MARKRTGLTGEVSKKLTPLDDFFVEAKEEVTVANESPVAEPVSETVDVPTVKDTDKSVVEDVVNPVDVSVVEPTGKDVVESVASPTVETKIDESIDSVIDSLPTIEKKVEEPTPAVVARGGKLKIAKGGSDKTRKINYTKLNEKGLYNLQKKTRENAREFNLKTKTMSFRPDLLAIIKEVTTNENGENVKNLQATIINNGVIKELVSIGVLDEDSLSELADY